VHQKLLKSRSDRVLLLEFERRYSRSKDKKCASVSVYPTVEVVKEPEEEVASPDSIEFDAGWEPNLSEYFRDVYMFKLCS
jgi:hypothetical protein